MIFVKHKPSTGSTQQEVTLRYNLFTFTHTHRDTRLRVKLYVLKSPETRQP